MKCRICDNDENLETYEVREMMFGLRDLFTYFQCRFCGCLQIKDIPEDMSKYYPSGYYSFNMSAGEERPLKRVLRRSRDSYAVTGSGFLGKVLNVLFPADVICIYKGTPLNASILDVGCGTGTLIYRLKEAGFTKLLGIDPFAADQATYANGLEVQKRSLREMTGNWDLITYHHSFEHISAPLEELQKVRELLSETGKCIIRIPVVDSYAWEHYRTDWVQLDAPRHFFLYSLKSFTLLAEKAGLMVEKVEFDSTAFQFWGSEQYKKDIPLDSDRSYHVCQQTSVFTSKELREFKRRSIALNRDHAGDQVIFYLNKK